MTRYQIYLNPQSVQIIDQLATQLDANRSQIIRDVIDRIAAEYKKFLTATKASRSNNPLLEMAGFAKSPTGKVSEDLKKQYLID